MQRNIVLTYGKCSNALMSMDSGSTRRSVCWEPLSWISWAIVFPKTGSVPWQTRYTLSRPFHSHKRHANSESSWVWLTFTTALYRTVQVYYNLSMISCCKTQGTVLDRPLDLSLCGHQRSPCWSYSPLSPDAGSTNKHDGRRFRHSSWSCPATGR